MARTVRSRRVVISLLTGALVALGGGGMTLATAAPAFPAAPAAAAAPSGGTITLGVTSLMDMAGVSAGASISTYQWMVNKDDTGDPGTSASRDTEHCLPSTAPHGSAPGTDLVTACQWPSIRATNSWAKVVAQGSQDDLDGTAARSLSLPGGKYLISVTSAGYKIAGAHFAVDGGTQPVAVKMLPTPLPLATVRIQVFNDNAPVDATYEADAEPGLKGFVGSLSDVTGRVSTDYFGNPLCTPYRHNADGTVTYDGNGRPTIDTAHQTGRCYSDAAGVITIPNLGEDRYAALVSPPVGQQDMWAETTTLEGGHDTDIWVQAGESGLDNEQMRGAEPVPSTQFGFAKVQALTDLTETGHLKGYVSALLAYIAGAGGQPGPTEGTGAGAKVGDPIANPWIALSDLNNGDQQIYVGRGAADGTFDIAHVPDGSYQLTAWDFDQDYILNSINVTVDNGQTVDVGLVPITGWFTHLKGTVFTDLNGNGKQDPGEPGVPQFLLSVRERDNSAMDQGLNTITTDDQGHYELRETYPLGKFLVLEAFNTRYQTTGITYQGDNELKPTTIHGGLVDFNFLAIIGIGGTVNWGVQPYAKADNGGIAGTVTYDTTRNELDPKDAVTESYQPGIPGLKVDLYAPVTCGTDAGVACSGGYEVEANGALKKSAQMLDQYTTEGWNAPKGCTARMWDGTPFSTTDQQALPEQGAAANKTCLEAPMAGVAMGAGDTSDPAGASTAVNGNYGFSGMPAGDYIVSVEIPDNPAGPATPMYKVTAEEDVNVFDGDSYVPQEDFAKAVHGGVVTADPPEATPLQPVSQQAGIISECVGATHKVEVTNANFNAAGGSPFEGQMRPSCQDKLITVRAGQTIAPNFNLFTPVPMPTHFWGLTLNDLNLSLDRTSANFGEAAGIPYVPVGLYDNFGNLVDTTHTDYNGLYEALEPSTDTYNCPLPAGPCPGMYRFVGNDPGGPAAPNPDYNPRFRTIATNFQAWPGLYTVTDQAPTQVAATILRPDATPVGITACDLPTTYPQLFAVDKPVVRVGKTTNPTSVSQRTVTVRGLHFGAAAGTVTVGTTTPAVASWTDQSISLVLPATTAIGAQPLTITTSGGGKAVNTVTLQVIRGAGSNSANNPRVYEVGTLPGQYTSIQAAVTAAEGALGTNPYSLVVVYPGAATTLTPHGEYLENVIVNSRIHIQGTGPGGFQGATWVPGSIVDGSGFNTDPVTPTTGPPTWFDVLAAEPTYNGDSAVPDAAVVTFLSPQRDTSRASSSWRPTFDGFQVTGGIQSNNVIAPDVLTGINTTPYGAVGSLITQGGGVYVHSGVNGVQLTDNLINGNGGSYGGGIRIGTPYVPGNHNYGAVIARNQVRDNGGTNLAGGIGLFQGSNGYSVTDNAVCGNHSSEYGGGISAFGFMGQTTGANGGSATIGSITSGANGASGGEIRRNRIWFNQSYDEGGGVMVAGELPPTPSGLTPGTGPLTIDANVITSNLANDDGGGIRLLQVSGGNVSPLGLGRISITNNTVTNNISTHEGGGIALDDALFVDIVNTTIAKNVTTATAVTSDGNPAAAGLTTAAISDPLQQWINKTSSNTSKTFVGTTKIKTPRSPSTSASLATYSNNDKLVSTRVAADGSPTSSWLGFGNPTLLNDVFYDNRAGTWSFGVVTGLGESDKDNWDLQVVDQAAGADPSMAKMTISGTVLNDSLHSPTYLTNAVVPQASTDPFAGSYDAGVYVLTDRANPQFRAAALVTTSFDIPTLGDYHLASGSPARAAGVALTTVRWGDEPTTAPSGSTLTTTGAKTVTYGVSAPSKDIDGQPRPTGGRYDAGSDQSP